MADHRALLHVQHIKEVETVTCQLGDVDRGLASTARSNPALVETDQIMVRIQGLDHWIPEPRRTAQAADQQNGFGIWTLCRIFSVVSQQSGAVRCGGVDVGVHCLVLKE